MGTARSGVAAAALDGSLYVVGGWDGSRRLRTGEVPSSQHPLVDHQQPTMSRCTTQPPTVGGACPR